MSEEELVGQSLLEFLGLNEIEESITDLLINNLVSFSPVINFPIHNSFNLSDKIENYTHQIIIFYNKNIVKPLLDVIVKDLKNENKTNLYDIIKKISIEKEDELYEIIEKKENEIFMTPIKKSERNNKLNEKGEIISAKLSNKIESISNYLHFSMGPGLEYMEKSLSKDYENITENDIGEYLDNFIDNMESMITSLLIFEGFHQDYKFYKTDINPFDIIQNKKNEEILDKIKEKENEYIKTKKEILQLKEKEFKNILLEKAYKLINYHKYKKEAYYDSFLKIIDPYLNKLNDNNLAIIELRSGSDELSRIYNEIKDLNPEVAEFVSSEIKSNYEKKKFYIKHIDLWKHANEHNWLDSLRENYHNINFKKAKPLLLKQENSALSELLSKHSKFNNIPKYPDINYKLLKKISETDNLLFQLSYKRLDIFNTIEKLSKKYDLSIMPKLIPALKTKSKMLLTEGDYFINLLLKSDFYQNELVKNTSLPKNYQLLIRLFNINEKLFNNTIEIIDDSQLETLISLAETNPKININYNNKHLLIPHKENEKKHIINAINNYDFLEKAKKYNLIKSKETIDIILEFSDKRILKKIENIENAEKYMHTYKNNFLRNKILNLIETHNNSFCEKYLHYFKDQGIYPYIRIIDLLQSLDSNTAKDICRKNETRNILLYKVGNTNDDEWNEINNILKSENPCKNLQKKYPGNYTEALKNQKKYDEEIGKRYLELQKIGKENLLDQLSALRTKKQISKKLFEKSIEMMDNKRYESVKIGIKQVTMGASENNILEFYDHTYIAESETEFLEYFNPAEDYSWWKIEPEKKIEEKNIVIDIREEIKQTEEYKKRSQEIKDAFRSGYHTNLSRKQMDVIGKYGLEVDYQANHLKIHKPGYIKKYVTCAVTPSDTRAGIKVAGEVIDLLLDIYVDKIENNQNNNQRNNQNNNQRNNQNNNQNN